MECNTAHDLHDIDTWGGPSALVSFSFLRFPGALPQAGMERAFGARSPWEITVRTFPECINSMPRKAGRNVVTLGVGIGIGIGIELEAF